MKRSLLAGALLTALLDVYKRQVLGILWLGGNVSCLCGLRGCGTGWNALLFDGWYISLNVVKYI